MDYIKPLNNEEIESEKIIEKLKLKAGQKIKIIKLKVLSESDIPVTNKERVGILKKDVQIGSPIEFINNGCTTKVLEIKKVNKKYFIRTRTSIYEVIEDILENKEKKITDFESFETKRGSVYNVLPNGQVQRVKHALSDPNYYGDDKGTNPEQDPSDIIFFYDESTRESGWFDDFQAIDPISGKPVPQVIDIGVYKKVDETTYQLVKNSYELGASFIFVRVRKEDTFKLKEFFDIKELIEFKERASKQKGLGTIISSDQGGITNIPVVGFKTVDYSYYENTNIMHRLHGGNAVVSINEKK